MSAKTVKLISPERAKRIIECYGSNPDAWPMDEKVAALSLIQHSDELKELQREMAGFDKQLKAGDVQLNIEASVQNRLINKIVDSLPEQDRKPDSRFTNQLPGDKKSFFDLSGPLGAIAASVAIAAISLSIVSIKPDQRMPVSSVTVAQTELDSWMWEQVVGESADEIEEPLTMMALLELEEL